MRISGTHRVKVICLVRGVLRRKPSCTALGRRRSSTGERVAIVLPTGLIFITPSLVFLAGGGRRGVISSRSARADGGVEATNRRDARGGGVRGRSDRTPDCSPLRSVHQAQLSIRLLQRRAPYQGKQDPTSYIALDNLVPCSSALEARVPKPVMLSHTNMLANASAILRTLPGQPSDHSKLSWLPLYHDMGLVGCLLSAIVAKGPLTLMGPEKFVAKPLRWLQALSETRLRYQSHQILHSGYQKGQ